MATFIICNRRAGKFTKVKKKASLQSVGEGFETHLKDCVDVVSDQVSDGETGRRIIVVSAEKDDIDAKRPLLGDDVLLEEAMPRFPCGQRTTAIATRSHDAQFTDEDHQRLTRSGLAKHRIGYTVTGGGKPLAGATVIQSLASATGQLARLPDKTDERGRVAFDYYPALQRPTGVIVNPAYDFWPAVFTAVPDGSELPCPPLPKVGSTPLWHQLMGIHSDAHDRMMEHDIRIGIIDTGVGPHPALEGINVVGSYTDGVFGSDGRDIAQHGTHVAGIIAAHSPGGDKPRGFVPLSQVYTLRVFNQEEQANQGDIAAAIDHLSKQHHVDLINLSLASPRYSQIEHDAILDALERGTLCVCAAANAAGEVQYPARLPETVAVSALGVTGWGPPGQLLTTTYPRLPDKFTAGGRLYLANFSCFGQSIDSTAPGVAIVSTVPTVPQSAAPYLAMDGTSMAAPCTTGFLAHLMAQDEHFLATERNLSRAMVARQLLTDACVDLGMRGIYQGKGLPVEQPSG